MPRDRFTRRLAVLAIPMTFSVVTAGVPWAQASSVRDEGEPCENEALSVVPISLCNVEP